ncbi:MAG: TIR domain-containing protein [Chloroflexi bacterium]|nr:TIR domain-containing protein [Chloroflexota bacterium]
MSMPKADPKRPKAFICHMKQDLAAAKKLSAELTAAGVDPWLDKEKLVSGDFYETEIKKAVHESDVFVPLLRPGFGGGVGFRHREVHWALEALESRPPGRGFIVPFLLRRCALPEWCQSIHAPLGLPVPTPVSEVLRAINKHCGTTLKEPDGKVSPAEVAEPVAVAPKAGAVAGAAYWSGPFGEPEWARIPAGEFWMGEGKEAHRVLLGEYRIARVPVTNAQYQLFVEQAGHQAPGHW